MKYYFVVLFFLLFSQQSFCCDLSYLSSLDLAVAEYDTNYQKNLSDDVTKNCYLKRISEHVFKSISEDKKTRIEIATYISSLAYIKNRSYINPAVKILIFHNLQNEWVERFYYRIGNHSTAVAKFRENPLLVKIGTLLGIGAGAVYLSRKFHQEVRLAKALILVSPRDAFWQIVSSPFGRAGIASYSGLASNELLSSKGLNLFERNKEDEDDLVDIPTSPANFYITQDTTELYMSYDLYSTIKDLSSVASGSALGIYYTLSRAGRKTQLAWTQIFRTLVRKSKTANSRLLTYLARLRYSRLAIGWTPVILAGVLGEKAVAKSFDVVSKHTRKNKIENSRNVFLSYIIDPKLHTQLPFVAEIYMTALNEYISFLMEPLKEKLVSYSQTYQISRFCSSYNYLYRRYIGQTGMYTNLRALDFSNRYRVRVGIEQEFNDIVSLSKRRLEEHVKAATEQHKETLSEALRVMNNAELDFNLLVQKSNTTQSEFYHNLKSRITEIRLSLLAFNEDDLLNYIVQFSEDIIFLQFANKSHLASRDLKSLGLTEHQIKDLTENRYCAVTDTYDQNYLTEEDVWRCYQPIAEELDCSHPLAPYTSR